MQAERRRFSVEELTKDALRFSTKLRPSASEESKDLRPIFEGRMLGSQICPGLYATGYDLTCLDDHSIDFEVGASLTCGLLLQGAASRVSVPGHATVSQELYHPILIGFGHGGECRTAWRRGQKCVMAGFTLRPEFFDRFGEAIADDGLSALQRFFRSNYEVATLPVTPRLSHLASASLESPFTHEMKTLYLESSTLAMLIEVARQASGRERTETLPGHHRRLLGLACERLDSDLASPPTLVKLSREIGTNVTTLQQIFKTGLGVTVLGYLQQRRLEVARVMLRERVGSARVIGQAVGFASASAFSAAYRRHFGHTPSVEAQSWRNYSVIRAL